MMPVEWTVEEDALLRAKRDESPPLSFTQIVPYFQGRSRNALIGRAGRLGLCQPQVKRPPGAPRMRRPYTPRPALPARVRVASSASSAPRAGPIDLDEAIGLPPDQSDCARGFFDVGDRCHWPVGDADVAIEDFQFCAAETGGLIYCERHWRRAHRKLPPRRAA